MLTLLRFGGQGHTEAERTGNNETNFIKWVNKCLKISCDIHL